MDPIGDPPPPPPAAPAPEPLPWTPPPPPPPPPRSSNRMLTQLVWIVLALSAGGALGGACTTCLGAAAGKDELVLGGGDKVGVVELVGEIKDTSEVVRQIREMAKRDDVQALVFRVDSPGGAVAPSQEIFSALRAAAKKKPVVASMGGLAASGGLWSALGADWIFAQPGTVTGSIGVISQVTDLRGVAELLRFQIHTFKSGPLKDAGNPFRELTPADEGLFMSLIDDIYDQFVSVVAERRHLERSAVKAFADGRVMTGRRALELGLVDELGGLVEASRKAAVLSQIKRGAKGKDGHTVTSTVVPESLEDPTLVYPKKPLPGFLRLITESTESAIARGLADGVVRAAERASSSEPSMELR